MASNKQDKKANTNGRTKAEGAIKTEASAGISGGNPIGDRLWLEHFALQLLRGGALDEAQYKKLLARIDRELAMRYKAGR